MYGKYDIWYFEPTLSSVMVLYSHPLSLQLPVSLSTEGEIETYSDPRLGHGCSIRRPVLAGVIKYCMRVERI